MNPQLGTKEEEEEKEESYLDDALLEHDETVVRPAGHQEEERLRPGRPEPE